MSISKSKIDRSGRVLSSSNAKFDETYVELDYVFEAFRERHLKPLTELTNELQNWLEGFGSTYYIAQRLKRKPQILRKLKRLSVRLSQLQDIGGCRIIVDTNNDVDSLSSYIRKKITENEEFKIKTVADYRTRGRDITGYRSLHLVILKDECFLELQIRSKIQHYWCESIERTSVVYGYHLKEQEGDEKVISYFQKLSDIFYEMEAGRYIDNSAKIALDRLRQSATDIIDAIDSKKIIASYVNNDIVRTLVEKEKSNTIGLNNWILVFDWNEGNFVSWDIVSKNPAEAVKTYIAYEKHFPAEQNFEVVLIGSSDVATVQKTHSHYFGIDTYDNVLENLDQSIIGFSNKLSLDIGSRQIISVLVRKKYWGKKSISRATLKNHYCKNVITFDSSLKNLIDLNLINASSSNGPISLNVKERESIERAI